MGRARVAERKAGIGLLARNGPRPRWEGERARERGDGPTRKGPRERGGGLSLFFFYKSI
jgi:hypothetical protein